MLNNKPSGGRANLFHHLDIPLSLNPSSVFSTLPFYIAIPACQFYCGSSNTERCCGRLPYTPRADTHAHTHTHTHKHRHISNKPNLIRWLFSLASSCCPFTGDVPFSVGPLRRGPWGQSTAILQLTYASWLHSCHVERLLGWR